MLKKVLLLGLIPFNHTCNIHLIPLLADRIWHLGYAGCHNVMVVCNLYFTFDVTFYDFAGAVHKIFTFIFIYSSLKLISICGEN